jgi:hypothetical protein
MSLRQFIAFLILVSAGQLVFGQERQAAHDISSNVSFFLNLDYNQVFEHVQEQSDPYLCGRISVLNGTFELVEENISESENAESIVKDELVSPCILLRTDQVLMNKSGHLFFSGKLSELEDLNNKVESHCMKFFLANHFDPTAIEVIWDKDHADSEHREYIVSGLIEAYQDATEGISNEIFRLPMCAFSTDQVRELGSKWMYALYSGDKYLPPLPAAKPTVIDLSHGEVDRK